jgi:hypothetical protein
MQRQLTEPAGRPVSGACDAPGAPWALEATVALVFAQALPGGVELGPDESNSYAEWLARQPGAESHADI